MAKLYGRDFSQIELMKCIGDISQIAGAKHYKLISGNEEEVEGVDFKTGTGFAFTVLPDRGMDISYAEYCGQPLCWRSSTGNVAAEYYEPTRFGWLRGFYGGLLSPHMILYHINGGYPSVDEDSRLVLSSKKVISMNKNAEAGLDAYDRFQAPTPGFEEQVYYHDMGVDEDGYAYAALINRNFKNGQGFGFYVKYAKATLPIFVQWKMNAVGSYVVGMEPANCHVEGREKEKEYGTLQ